MGACAWAAAGRLPAVCCEAAPGVAASAAVAPARWAASRAACEVQEAPPQVLAVRAGSCVMLDAGGRLLGARLEVDGPFAPRGGVVRVSGSGGGSCSAAGGMLPGSGPEPRGPPSSRIRYSSFSWAAPRAGVGIWLAMRSRPRVKVPTLDASRKLHPSCNCIRQISMPALGTWRRLG